MEGGNGFQGTGNGWASDGEGGSGFQEEEVEKVASLRGGVDDSYGELEYMARFCPSLDQSCPLPAPQ